MSESGGDKGESWPIGGECFKIFKNWKLVTDKELQDHLVYFRLEEAD